MQLERVYDAVNLVDLRLSDTCLLFLDVRDRLLRDEAERFPEFVRYQHLLDEMRQEGASKVAGALFG